VRCILSPTHAELKVLPLTEVADVPVVFTVPLAAVYPLKKGTK
jgi:hypothetical protein